mmetsp:Transcript_10866/g.28973  ORF Transcript_10866/g.28973 Transcript_10866/m.28973 type:complete len:338 (-) Transcript_10866:751-1764(-)
MYLYLSATRPSSRALLLLSLLLLSLLLLLGGVVLARRILLLRLSRGNFLLLLLVRRGTRRHAEHRVNAAQDKQRKGDNQDVERGGELHEEVDDGLQVRLHLLQGRVLEKLVKMSHEEGNGVRLLFVSLGIRLRLLRNLLRLEAKQAQLLRDRLVVRDEQVVEVQAAVHRPDLRTHGGNLAHRLERRVVLEVRWVGNLARCPRSLVGWVRNARRVPLSLVVRVRLHRRLPLAAANVVARGVLDHRRLPLAILLLVPVLRLLRLRVRDLLRLVVEPSFGLFGLLVLDLHGRILVPVVRLRGIRVVHLVVVNPVLRFLVLRVVDLLRRVERRVERFKDRS